MPVAAWLALFCGALLLPAGCGPAPKRDVEAEFQAARRELTERTQQLEAQQVRIAELEKRLDAVRAIDAEVLKHIFYPTEIRIDKLSGGFDTDNQPGDEGVVVYLRPVDRTGDTIKVAGDIRIQLYDLAAPAERTFVGEYFVKAEQSAELWYGRLMTDHFTVKCPWTRGPPAHSEITVRVTFVDLLTQRVLTAQAVVTVKLPPGARK